MTRQLSARQWLSADTNTTDPTHGKVAWQGARSRSNTRRRPSSSGVALILVIFIVALATIIVVNLTYSTFLSAELQTNSERALKAEYLLKSAVNFGRVLLQTDSSPDDYAHPDPTRGDVWGPFFFGIGLPAHFLDIDEPNVQVFLELRPEEAKAPLRALVPSSRGQPDRKWRDAFVRLFRELGFDADEQKDHTGLLKGRVLNSEQLVAALIDYVDGDTDSYEEPGFARGIESELPKGTFPNRQFRRFSELAAIPGFTPARRQKLEPLITTVGNNKVNINVAPAVVLAALHESIGAEGASQIVAYRDSEDGPFTHPNWTSDLGNNIIGTSVMAEISSMVNIESRYFQAIAKVDYGTSTYFMRAFLAELGEDELPRIQSVELFG